MAYVRASMLRDVMPPLSHRLLAMSFYAMVAWTCASCGDEDAVAPATDAGEVDAAPNDAAPLDLGAADLGTPDAAPPEPGRVPRLHSAGPGSSAKGTLPYGRRSQ